jgi:hypothetical protein
MAARARYETVISIFVAFAMLLAFGYALALAGSRFPTVIGLILAMVIMRNIVRTNKGLGITVMLVIGALAMFVAVQPELLESIRLSEGSGGRWDKLVLPLEMLTSNFLDLLIGSTLRAIDSATSAEGIGISDNSYMLMALQFGMPFAVVWFSLVFVQLKSIAVHTSMRYTLLYFLLALGVTNAILWEPWLFYFSIAYVCAAGNEMQIARRSRDSTITPRQTAVVQ